MGDAPSWYFFAQIKAKCASEKLCCIRLEDGTLVEEEEGLLQEVEAFYSTIYAKDHQIQSNEIERLSALESVSRRIFECDKTRLDALPTLEEVEVVLCSFKVGKALGLDGLTVEVLQFSWEWVKECLEVIHAFWADGILTAMVARGCDLTDSKER